MKLKKFTALCLSAVISLGGSAYAFKKQESNFSKFKLGSIILPAYIGFKFVRRRMSSLPTQKTTTNTNLQFWDFSGELQRIFDSSANGNLNTQNSSPNVHFFGSVQ